MAKLASSATIALCALALMAGAQHHSELPPANTVVKPRAYVSLEPVPRGQTFEIAVVAEIQEGFHINANKVLEDYLIPTSLHLDVPPGLKLLETTYPPGQLQKFGFSDKALNVYDGRVTLKMKLRAAENAQTGPTTLPVLLRYQACNDRACLPPVRLSVPVEVRVAEAGAKTRPLHAEIFRSAAPSRKK
jgi:DsbC/DsbD-like thiol-disulfide interchange protein